MHGNGKGLPSPHFQYNLKKQFVRRLGRLVFPVLFGPRDGLRGGGWHKASVFGCLPLAAPIGPSLLLVLTLRGPERVSVVVVIARGEGGKKAHHYLGSTCFRLQVLFRPNTVFEITSTLYGTSDIGQFYSGIDNISMAERTVSITSGKSASAGDLASPDPSDRRQSLCSLPPVFHMPSSVPGTETIIVTVPTSKMTNVLTSLAQTQDLVIDSLQTYEDLSSSQVAEGLTAIGGAPHQRCMRKDDNHKRRGGGPV